MPDPHHEPVNEYEREPVPEQARLGLKSFVGQCAGEHVAGTELMIGPLFLAAGLVLLLLSTLIAGYSGYLGKSKGDQPVPAEVKPA